MLGRASRSIQATGLMRELPGAAAALNARSSAPLASSTLVRALSAEKESYTERQERLGRPVSPHVTIYKFPVTALTSIANRGTGVALTVGLYGVGATALAGVDVSAVMTAVGSSAVAPVAKLAVAFPLVYHYLGAVRHAFWDRTPDAVSNDQVEKASWVLIGSATAASLGLAAISIGPK